MAARLWRWLVGCGLLASAGLGTALALLLPVPPAIAPAIAILTAVCLPLLLLVSSFAVAMAGAGRMGAADLRCWIHALAREAIFFNRSVLDIIRRPVPAARIPATGTRPLLLIHGVACNGAVWTHWIGKLGAAGFAPIRAIDLEPVFADIDVHAARVAGELLTLQQHAGGARVAIVAHSMGGLVARAAFGRVGPTVVSRMVTIGSPHHGTRLARLFHCTPLRQMRRDSAWLESLNATRQPGPAGSLTNIYSREDNLIVPGLSAALPGARQIEIRGWGHLGLLASKSVADHAIAALAAS